MLQMGEPPLQTSEHRTFNSRFPSTGHEWKNLLCAKGGRLEDDRRKLSKEVFSLVQG